MITPEQKDILNDYAEIKKDIKLLELKADELNPQVLEIMRVSDVEEISLDNVGKLTIGERRTWKYSLDVENADKLLKKKKKIEEQTGKADCIIKHHVIFKELKENNEN